MRRRPGLWLHPPRPLAAIRDRLAQLLPHDRAQPPRAAKPARWPISWEASGLAWHQWNKHGVCTGLSAAAYFALSRLAYGAVTRPDLLRRLDREVRLPAAVIEEAFLEVNPDLEPDMLTVTCRANRIQEVRICLTRDLTPRRCGTDVIRDCTSPDAPLFADALGHLRLPLTRRGAVCPRRLRRLPREFFWQDEGGPLPSISQFFDRLNDASARWRPKRRAR